MLDDDVVKASLWSGVGWDAPSLFAHQFDFQEIKESEDRGLLHRGVVRAALRCTLTGTAPHTTVSHFTGSACFRECAAEGSICDVFGATTHVTPSWPKVHDLLSEPATVLASVLS